MEIELPAIPAGVLTLIGALAPLLIALANNPRWSRVSKTAMSLGISLAIAIISLGGYYLLTGDAIPSWPWLVLLFLVVVQFAYAIVWKGIASQIEKQYGVK